GVSGLCDGVAGRRGRRGDHRRGDPRRLRHAEPGTAPARGQAVHYRALRHRAAQGRSGWPIGGRRRDPADDLQRRLAGFVAPQHRPVRLPDPRTSYRDGAMKLPDLPVRAVLGDLGMALDAHGTAVLVAPPGTGKTTIVPLALAERSPGRIVVAEPRRLAARAA